MGFQRHAGAMLLIARIAVLLTAIRGRKKGTQSPTAYCRTSF